ncbi:MAG: ribonuclease III [Lachnospiraceae bacterium]|nr:ribonuclease III [Lachnospiraceae bacterium]
MTDLPGKIKEQFDIKDTDINTYNPLTLAFIGDSVYETIVRTIVVTKGNKSVNALAKDKNKLVNAKTQSRIAEILTDYYTEEEADIYRRGKNAKTANHSKSAAYSEYHRATGLEAVFGYLYLTGNLERCIELLKTALDKIEE